MSSVTSFLMSLMGKAKGVGFYIIVILVIAYQVQVGLSYMLNQAATDYAFEVISINLKGAGGQEEIKQLVTQWKRDEWGAQLGAIRVLCDNTPHRLDSLTGTQMRLDLCRLVR